MTAVLYNNTQRGRDCGGIADSDDWFWLVLSSEDTDHKN